MEKDARPIDATPSVWERALVWSAKWKEWHIAELRGNDGSFYLGDWEYIIPDVTHWMPLPPPPARTLKGE